jgi:hypothetical protein
MVAAERLEGRVGLGRTHLDEVEARRDIERVGARLYFVVLGDMRLFVEEMAEIVVVVVEVGLAGRLVVGREAAGKAHAGCLDCRVEEDHMMSPWMMLMVGAWVCYLDIVAPADAAVAAVVVIADVADIGGSLAGSVEVSAVVLQHTMRRSTPVQPYWRNRTLLSSKMQRGEKMKGRSGKMMR